MIMLVMDNQCKEIIHNMVMMLKGQEEGKFDEKEVVAYFMGVIHTLEVLGIENDIKDTLEGLITEAGR